MKFLRYFRRFSSSKTHFVPIFARQASYIKQAAMMKTTDQSEWRRLEKEIKMCEVQGDAMLTEFYGELYENIITPIGRDHLQTIAMYTDDFLDNINGSAKSVLLYLPAKIGSEADALKSIISMFGDIRTNFSALSLQCERISELEHAADDSYEDFIGDIFQNEKNPIELMKYKNIAENLETTSDSAKKVSDHVRTILLSYAE